MKKRSPPRCPRCRALPVQYVELWRDHSIAFDVRPDGTPEPEGDLDDGEAYCVYAECRCGHRWRLRGVLQITELRQG